MTCKNAVTAARFTVIAVFIFAIVLFFFYVLLKFWIATLVWNLCNSASQNILLSFCHVCHSFDEKFPALSLSCSGYY